MKQFDKKTLYETTSTLRSILLAVFQVVFPYIFVVIAFILLKHYYKNYAWISILCGIIFVLVWMSLSLILFIYKEWCYIDQLNFLIPLFFTIGFILFATYYSLLWWAYLLGSVVFIILGYFISRIIVNYFTSKTQLSLHEEHMNYLNEDLVQKKEHDYIKEFLDIYKNDKKNKKRKNRKK